MDITDITDVEIDGAYSWDYPDFADAYVSSAVWGSTGQPLTEEELIILNEECGEFVNEQAHEYFR